QWL
ncbi:excinuclease ABC, subunit A domain protein, partial [Chlamydia psittaci 84-8471/1]